MSSQVSNMAIKSAQAVNFFLDAAENDSASVDGDMMLKLIKLMWATDRFSLRSFGSTVTDSNYFAMKYGPVASQAYDLMKVCVPGSPLISRWISEADGEYWRNCFEKRIDHSMKLIGDPGSDYLSHADVRALEKAYENFRTAGRFQVANDISHNYPEWNKVYSPEGNTSFTINMDDFFEDPVGTNDPYFQVDSEMLEVARYFYNERKNLFASIEIPL
ncbi:type II toxin-antitoxin system antitoxin SocA domain-containing protein [Corynebacterium casei]|uniref:type II toxin-antitoxin system antitoxin SocA domain-containing protein n=1 Tax=Corynebacterium casei TaxID=160386 RepID=UPI003FD4FBCE